MRYTNLRLQLTYLLIKTNLLSLSRAAIGCQQTTVKRWLANTTSAWSTQCWYSAIWVPQPDWLAKNGTQLTITSWQKDRMAFIQSAVS